MTYSSDYFDNILYKRLTNISQPESFEVRMSKGKKLDRAYNDDTPTNRFRAKKKKVKMYILFIDFEKAYDKVVRVKLDRRVKTTRLRTDHA